MLRWGSMAIAKNRPAHLNPQRTIPSSRAIERVHLPCRRPCIRRRITRSCAQGDHSKLHKRDRYLGGSDELFLNTGSRSNQISLLMQRIASKVKDNLAINTRHISIVKIPCLSYSLRGSPDYRSYGRRVGDGGERYTDRCRAR